MKRPAAASGWQLPAARPHSTARPDRQAQDYNCRHAGGKRRPEDNDRNLYRISHRFPRDFGSTTDNPAAGPSPDARGVITEVSGAARCAGEVLELLAYRRSAMSHRAPLLRAALPTDRPDEAWIS
jgi:hypothetical protein